MEISVWYRSKDVPSKPEMLLSNMKGAEVAAVVFCPAQPPSSNMGDKNTPPPIPVIPERKPKAAPIPKPAHKGIAVIFSRATGLPHKNTAAGINRQTPKIVLYTSVSTCNLAPKNAMGTEANTNGQNKLPLKCPFRAKCQVAIADTPKFNTKAS